MNNDYPVKFSVDYGDGTRNRLTTFFRLIAAIPFLFVVVLSGGLLLAPLPLILFRKKYPRWMFDYHLELYRLQARFGAYLSLVVDQYPSSDEEQSVHLEIKYPDASTELNRYLPLVKWLLAIPHYACLIVLGIVAFLLGVAAWFAILRTGRYPKQLFDLVVGVNRWNYRVTAYAFLLTTDRYPPFRLS